MVKSSVITKVSNIKENKVYALHYHWVGRKRLCEKKEIKYYYIFVPEQEKVDEGEYIVESGYKCVDGTKLKKVSPKRNLNREEFQKFVSKFKRTYESDFLAIDRYLCEEKPTFTKHIRKWYLDIEIARDSTGAYSPPMEANSKIISISFYDSFMKQYFCLCLTDEKKQFQKDNIRYYLFTDEYEMLKSFIDAVEQLNPDVFLGWNIDGFDMPYIYGRMKRLFVPLEKMSPINVVYDGDKMDKIYIKGRQMFDLMEAAKQMWLGTDVGYSLDAISRKYLGRGKVKVDDIEDTYHNDIEKFLEYNLTDVKLCIDLDEKLDIVSTFQEFQDVISINLQDTFQASKLIYYYVLQKTDRRLMNRRNKDVRAYPGGYVHDISKGIFDNVLKFDFSSMYPTHLVSMNISPDTISEELDRDIKFEAYYNWKDQKTVKRIKGGYLNVKTGGEIVLEPQQGKEYESFRCSFSKEEGIMTKVTKELLNKRLKAKREGKKRRATVLKRLINSIYGVYAYKYSRIFNFGCGLCITLASQRLIKTIILKIERRGIGKVLLSDTDSIIVDLYKDHKEADVLAIAEETYKEMMELYNIDNHIWNLELEDKIDRLILFGVKKKYVEKIGDENIVIGLEMKRRDAPEAVKELQRLTINYIMTEKNPNLRGLEFIKGEIIKKVRSSIVEGNWDYIAIPTVIRKPLSQYVSNTMEKKALRSSNIKISINEQFKVLFLANNSYIAYKSNNDLKDKWINIDSNKLFDRIFKNYDLFTELFVTQKALSEY